MEFAKVLASKLGYECVSREDLLEEATRQGIPVGKLETEIVKPHIHSERLAAELEHYKALATSILCEKALDHSIVYHGRTGHLLLPGISHILRVRVVASMEQRIEVVMARLNLSRKKAKQYIEAVEEDRRKWVRRFYNVDWDVYTLYDLVLNLSQVSPGNAATAVCSMAQLPEFRPTPASVDALKDLLLAAKARLALARAEETSNLNAKITARRGIVYVTYSFLQAKKAVAVTAVLQDLPGATQVVCTEAQTNVLWIQESFDAADRSCADVLSLANTWDAAVEIIKFAPGKELTRLPVDEEFVRRGLETWRQTGIIDESDEVGPQEPEDVSRIYDRLINSGRAGGKRVLEGSLNNLLGAIDRSVQYRLIVFDNVFLSRSMEARKRSIQEWSNTLSDSLKTPVVTIKEIQSHYRFGAKQALQMAFAALLTVIILFAVFHFESSILAFLLREGTVARILSAACIAVFVPVFAFIYGSVAGLFLRMVGMD
jgi:cytidylate kinase